MQLLFLILVVVSGVSAQLFRPAWNIEPSLFPQAQPFEEPGLFNYIPAAQPQHNIFHAPSPLGWGKKK